MQERVQHMRSRQTTNRCMCVNTEWPDNEKLAADLHYYYYYFIIIMNIIPREIKNFNEKKEKQVRSSIRAVNGRQTVMWKDSIEALHQYRDSLVVQEACAYSLIRVQRNPPSKVIKEVESWCVEYAQGLCRNWLNDVAGTCLTSGSINIRLGQRACNSDIPT